MPKRKVRLANLEPKKGKRGQGEEDGVSVHQPFLLELRDVKFWGGDSIKYSTNRSDRCLTGKITELSA